MKALEVRIRKVRKGDIDRIIDIERSWHHLSHWSIDSYYRLLNDDSFTSSFVAEIEDEDESSRRSSDLSFFTLPRMFRRSTTLPSKTAMRGPVSESN